MHINVTTLIFHYKSSSKWIYTICSHCISYNSLFIYNKNTKTVMLLLISSNKKAKIKLVQTLKAIYKTEKSRGCLGQ